METEETVMLTALFLVWLQMSAQATTAVFSETSHCQEGMAITIILRDGKSDEIAKCVNGYYERVPRAADETDGKLADVEPHLTTLHQAPNPPSGNMECWNDSETSDFICHDAKGRTVDVTKALIRLMESDVDVPAVQEPSKEPPNGPKGFTQPHGKYTKWCTDSLMQSWDNVPIEWCVGHPPMIDTCADKSRVLLTSEDGKKHCVKF